MRNDIKELIQSSLFCVLATVSGGNPHCSLMSYATNDDCREIYMVTQKNTQKYRNLKENPSVSLLIDSRELHPADRNGQAKALTVTGTFSEISSMGKKADIKNRLLARHPDLHRFIDHSEAEIFMVRVTALQLLVSLTDTYFETVL